VPGSVFAMARRHAGKARAARAVALAFATLTISACGEDEPTVNPETDTAAIEDTWARFMAAARDSDGAAACAELSTDLESPEDFAPQIGSPRPAAGTECDDYLAEPSATAPFISDATDELESVDFQESTAQGTAGGAKPTFVEEDDGWKISSLYGVPTP